MKVVVLGASGGCGQQLVEQAAARGHVVTAVVRSVTWQPPKGVTVVRGALADESILRRAFEGHDVVLSALGLRMNGYAPWAVPHDVNFLRESTPAIVSAMKATGLSRVIAISAGGVGDSEPQMPFLFRTLLKVTALNRAYAELLAMESIYLSSGLEVLLPRPMELSNGPLTGKGVVPTALSGRPVISRADVAGWILDQLDRPFSSSRTPVITVTGAA